MIVQRSRLFITVLLSLFIFQGVWNVAVAFCIHENRLDTQTISHFGHYSLTYKLQKPQSSNHDSSAQLIQYLDQIDDNDHDDHLPAVHSIHVCPQSADVVQVAFYHVSKFIFLDQNNLYQSPYLNLPTQPPPSLTPL